MTCNRLVTRHAAFDCSIRFLQGHRGPTRRAILARLRMGPVAVNTLAAAFEQSRPAISKHPRVLREAGLVAKERRGRERFYRLQADPLREVADRVQTNRQFWPTSLDRLKTSR